MKSIQIMAHWVPNTGDPTTPGEFYGRIAIVYDRRPAGGYPAIADIFRGITQDGSAVANDPWAPTYAVNTDRFMVIRDCKFNFPTNNPENTNVLANFMFNNTFIEGSQCNLFKKLNGLGTQFLSTANPVKIGNVATGALYLIFWANNAAEINSAGTVTWTSRLRFYDF